MRGIKIFLTTFTLLGMILLAGMFFAYHPKKEVTLAKTEQTEEKKSVPKSEVVEKKEKDNTIAAVDKAPELSDYLTQQHFSGTVLVVKNNQVLLSKSFDLANRETREENTVADGYYIGSAQKAIVATALLQLEEAGKLKITDPIGKYIPDFPNGDKITLKNLLNHTSGINGRSEGSLAVTPQQVVSEIAAKGIKEEPGNWSYTDSNYALVGYIVQVVSQMDLKTYIQEHIFDKAKMQHAGFGEAPRGLPAPVTSYRVKDGQYDQQVMPDMSQLFGAGDMFMTATDLYLFDQALMKGTLIDEKERTEMLTSGSSSTYGAGFYAEPTKYTSHGVIGGFNTMNSISRDGKIYVVLLGNTNQTDLGAVNNHLFELLSENR